MRLALIENGRVKTIIIGKAANYPEYIDVSAIQCGVGWLANNDGTYTNDAIPPTPQTGGVAEVKELLRQATVILNTL